MSEERIRAFLAVPSDPMWVESARGLVERLRGSLPEASWTKPESWHITLRFLGDVSASAIETFASQVAPAAAEMVPGEIHSRDAVVFPPKGPARVLGVGFAPSEILEGIVRLAAVAEQAARAAGMEEVRRPFHPHVTLARLRQPWPREAVASYAREIDSWAFPPWQARACVLYSSRLEKEGAVHTPLQEWSFIGGPRGVRA